jgi:hypothetical protein
MIEDEEKKSFTTSPTEWIEGDEEEEERKT